MLQNAYFLAKIGADTAEHEQHFAEILPKIGNYPTGPPIPERLKGVAKDVQARFRREAQRCGTVYSTELFDFWAAGLHLTSPL